MLKINGVIVPQPSAMTVDVADLDGETGRVASGTIVRDRIAVKRKINCKWNALTNAQMSTLLQAVTAIFFEATYPDPLTGAVATRTFYVGDRNAAVYTYHTGTPMWEGLTMNFIER